MTETHVLPKISGYKQLWRRILNQDQLASSLVQQVLMDNVFKTPVISIIKKN